MSHMSVFNRLRDLVPLTALVAFGSAATLQPMQTFGRALDELSIPEAQVGARATESIPNPPAWPERIDGRLRVLAAESRNSLHDARGLPSAAGPTRTPADPSSSLHDRLDGLVARAPAHAELGVSVRDLASGEEVFDWQADRALNPASNQKLLIATAALELLGEDFRFSTRLARRGDTLYLVGGGDPTLQARDIRSIAQAVLESDLEGIRRIEFDDAMFSDQRFGPGYDPDGPGEAFAAPSGALSMQFNTVEVTVRPGRSRRLIVSVFPSTPSVRVDSTGTVGRRNSLRVDALDEGDTTVVRVRGELPSGSESIKLRRRIVDPGMFTASCFADAIAKRQGGEPLPIARGVVPADADTLHVHESAPLTEVLAAALHFSNNFTSEQILRSLGHLASDEPGDWDNGRQTVEQFWQAIGLDPNALVFENAAGLSRRGRVSARALTELTRFWTRRGSGTPIVAAMPIAGREGTLKQRLHQSGGRVRAKTGTLSDAWALTGVVADDAGTPKLGFSILVNGRINAGQARDLQDRMVMAMLENASG